MTRINLGASASGPVSIDLDVLLRTRLLVQASSGGGKSWVLRRLTEQLFGHVQVIVIDPEGEFATLRERFGYVLAGKGGETPADRRSAALLAHRLLELNASAVCDLYEMAPRERHAWVRIFLEALIDAPKKLWHGLVVIVDEAHVFAPEKGAGESEASDAMIGLATRGRKRGFCPVFATQRLGKLRKDAAAELLNVLVGQTFIDVDRKRAAEMLGIAPAEQRAFYEDVRLLKPGKFWALGRAIATERTLVTVGPVTTTHPEAGSAKHSAEPPAAPEKVRALLPKLADLPAQAEAKVATERELRTTIAQLERDLKAARAPQPAPDRMEVPILDEAGLLALRQLTDVTRSLHTDALKRFDEVLTLMRGPEARRAGSIPAKPAAPAHVHQLTPASSVGRVSAPAMAGRSGATVHSWTPASNDGRLAGPEQRVLDALAELRQLGVDDPERVQVAFLAGYSHLNSKGFANALGSLRSSGLIEYPATGRIRLTEVGAGAARPPAAPRSTAELQDRVLQLLGGSHERLLRPLIDAYPRPLEREALAAAAGYGHLNSKGFANAIGRLRSLGFIEYPARGQVVASRVLFLEGAR